MKKTALTIVASVIFATLFVALFSYSQISALQNKIANLEAENGELHDQLSELQSQLNEVQLQNREQQDRLSDFTYELAKVRQLNIEISAFQWIGGFNPIGGLNLGHPVNVTVQNNDVVPLSGLKLTVTLANENTGAKIGRGGGGITIDRIDAGESQTVYIDAMNGPWTSLDSSLEDAVCVATLTASGVVLDSGTFELN